ncbi:response regulator transcription factor [Sulfuricystis thermophila]|uniref:response regulator transcription factor n=1 Tax=Sulfuricystis thermophila TaxID=2496847 RepID=UPI0024DF94D3|nr:response regulator transcription factor [Sulfuricystis thermophila]
MRILVIEDHALVREGLLLALKALEESPDASPLEILGARDADEATHFIEQNDDFDLCLLDLMLPGTGGLAFLGVLRKRYPHIPVVVLLALDDADTVAKVMKGGAAGFVSKASPTDVLLGALREVLAGEIWLPPEYRGMSGKRKRARTVAERYGLTKSQACVLDLLAEGKTNREIAELLGVTEGTVKIHVSAIFKALGVSNRSQALLVAQGKN